MRFFTVFVSAVMLSTPGFSFGLDELKEIVVEQVGAPGVTRGEYTVFMDEEIAPGVSILMGCSAGKNDGLGEKVRSSLVGVIDGIPAPFPLNIGRNKVSKLVEKGALTIDEGEGFCFAIAHETRRLKRAPKIRKGSIYVTTWKDGKQVGELTDKRYCRRLARRVGCYEVVELPEGHTSGIDGVSGCFQAEVDGVLTSISMGRGKDILSSYSDTFSSAATKSNLGCVARGLGKEQTELNEG